MRKLLSFADFKANSLNVKTGGKMHTKSRKKGKDGWKTLSEGLMSHITQVLRDHNISDEDWEISGGNFITVQTEDMANHIMAALDDSGQFGPTRYNKSKKRIEIGTHGESYPKDQDFDAYVQDFKAFRDKPTTAHVGAVPPPNLAEARVFNATDQIYASPKKFKDDQAAQKFIDELRATFKKQGFYLTANGDKIKPEELELTIVNESNGIRWSGGDVTKKKPIGTIEIAGEVEIAGQKIKLDEETLNVVEIVDDGKLYITDKWYKPGVPRIVHKDMVKKFLPASPGK